MAVEIVPYREGWPGEFREIAGKMRGTLGDHALRIDHIGSTAVPGLPAKDVIDIQITVAALVEPVRAALASIRYSRREDITGDHCPPDRAEAEGEWTKWYFSAPAGQRRTNTHVRVSGRGNQRFALLFRDYLRAHPASAAAYAELKRRLAANLADPDTYPDVKDPAVDLIYLAAEAWAETRQWQPGPSDA
jgi:GrpB-like predicted nucleotidyltransferase (UPF0157 family)